MIFLNLFLVFAKIALFTFGGGYAMIPLYQQELVDRCGYLTAGQFADIVALAQMTPGPVGLNAATYVGYQIGLAQSGIPAPWGGILGSTIATIALAAPSLVITTLVAMSLRRFADSRLVKAALSGIRPAVLGLIAAAVLFFAETSVFSAPLRSLWTGRAADFGVRWPLLLVFGIVFAVRWRWRKVGTLTLLLVSAALGALLL